MMIRMYDQVHNMQDQSNVPVRSAAKPAKKPKPAAPTGAVNTGTQARFDDPVPTPNAA